MTNYKDGGILIETRIRLITMKPSLPPTRRQIAEDNIKEAARSLFTKKGYAATKTRDIARAAGVNLALLNYYYRSKEELYGIVIVENYGAFLHGLSAVLNDKQTSIQHKINAVVSAEIDMLTSQPDLPLFILNEVVTNTDQFIKKMNLDKLIKGSYLLKQIKAGGGFLKTDYNPIHLLINLLSLTIAPFVLAPVLRKITGISQLKFNALMAERKSLIPIWAGQMLKTVHSAGNK